MKTVNLRDANQQFSKLVREIEETGEAVLVTRNGKPAVRLSPAGTQSDTVTIAQQEAMRRLRDPRNHFKSPTGWRFDKDEMYDEAVLRHRSVRNLWSRATANKKPTNA